MPEPTIVIGGDVGLHNLDLKKTKERLKQGKQYKDISTVCIVPTRGLIPARVVESWMSLIMPMNNRFVRMFVSGMEVADAYNKGIETILSHPALQDFKYLLTMEEDNMPPPDGLIKLLENICDCKRPCKEHFVQVAGLYFTKGEFGQPMIYGDPNASIGFHPQVPRPDKIQECNGTGMGFTLFHMGLFRDKNVQGHKTQEWFKTTQDYDPMLGVQLGTQDLYFMGNIRKLGYRIASDNRVKVGHYDYDANIVW